MLRCWVSFGGGCEVCFCSVVLTRRLLRERFFRVIRMLDSRNCWFSSGVGGYKCLYSSSYTSVSVVGVYLSD